MNTNCKCGGRIKRTDIEPFYSTIYHRTLYRDTDPIYANFACDNCKRVYRQRKRQPKIKPKSLL